MWQQYSEIWPTIRTTTGHPSRITECEDRVYEWSDSKRQQGQWPILIANLTTSRINQPPTGHTWEDLSLVGLFEVEDPPQIWATPSGGAHIKGRERKLLLFAVCRGKLTYAKPHPSTCLMICLLRFWHRLKTSSPLTLPWDSSSRLGLLRNPAWQMTGSLAFPSGEAIAGCLRTMPVSHCNVRTIYVHVYIYTYTCYIVNIYIYYINIYNPTKENSSQVCPAAWF